APVPVVDGFEEAQRSRHAHRAPADDGVIERERAPVVAEKALRCRGEGRRFAAVERDGTSARRVVIEQESAAADAVVAAQLVLGLVEPQSSGLGGGAFLLYHDAASGHAVAFDGRETAPFAATPQRFLGDDGRPLAFDDAVVGGRSVGVPGTLRLLEAVHRRYGRLAWSRLFASAIELATRGFPVSPRLHALIVADAHFLQPRAREYFLTPDGTPLAVGHMLTNPA